MVHVVAYSVLSLTLDRSKQARVLANVMVLRAPDKQVPVLHVIKTKLPVTSSHQKNWQISMKVCTSFP